MTFNEWCLSIVQQIRTDIAPGVSGWVRGTEGSDLRGLIKAAQVTVGAPDDLQVRNRIAGQVVEELPGNGNERQTELNATVGEFNAALIATEAHFQDLVDEDNAEP